MQRQIKCRGKEGKCEDGNYSAAFRATNLAVLCLRSDKSPPLLSAIILLLTPLHAPHRVSDASSYDEVVRERGAHEMCSEQRQVKCQVWQVCDFILPFGAFKSPPRERE